MLDQTIFDSEHASVSECKLQSHLLFLILAPADDGAMVSLWQSAPL